MPLVLHVSEQALAGWPLRLCQALTRWTDWRARCLVRRHQYPRVGLEYPADLVMPRDREEIRKVVAQADLVAFHGMHGPLSFPWDRSLRDLGRKLQRKPLTAHYHVDPGVWDDSIPRAGHPCTVSAWYHADLAPPEWRVLPHCLDTDQIRPNPRPPYDGKRKLRVAWTPSNRNDRPNHPSNKGAAATDAVLESLPEIQPVIGHGLPVDRCLEVRGACDVALDELVSGSIHQTTIENMALGTVPVFRASRRQIERITGLGLSVSGCNIAGVHELPALLRELAQDPARVEQMKLLAREQALRWDGQHIAPLYAAFYDEVVAGRLKSAPDRPAS